jgi:phosphoglycerate dehydrogenase-like enzyme
MPTKTDVGPTSLDRGKTRAVLQEAIHPKAGARESRGKTLGIVGYGHIGTQVGLLAEALGMRVL